MEKKSIELERDLYSINKDLMSDIKPLTKKNVKAECSKVTEEIWKRNGSFPKYWMLLCRERNDYTIFEIINSLMEFEKALAETLLNRGKILSILKTSTEDGYEIWVRDEITNENFVYYFFDYHNGIVEV